MSFTAFGRSSCEQSTSSSRLNRLSDNIQLKRTFFPATVPASQTNGNSNGTNGHANGNGNANGSTNGNGHVPVSGNGHANGSTNGNGKRLPSGQASTSSGVSIQGTIKFR